MMSAGEARHGEFGDRLRLSPESEPPAMTVASDIHDTVVEALAPVHLDVINESHAHNVAAGSETHFKLIVVSEAFADQPLIKRHRTLNGLLKPQLDGPVHALSLHPHTPDEWRARGQSVPDSPPCRGGMARERRG